MAAWSRKYKKSPEYLEKWRKGIGERILAALESGGKTKIRLMKELGLSGGSIEQGLSEIQNQIYSVGMRRCTYELRREE